jgi:hypothetical protein
MIPSDSYAIVVPAPLPSILLHPTRNERFIVAFQEIFFAFNTQLAEEKCSIRNAKSMGAGTDW